LVKSITYTN